MRPRVGPARVRKNGIRVKCMHQACNSYETQACHSHKMGHKMTVPPSSKERLLHRYSQCREPRLALLGLNLLQLVCGCLELEARDHTHGHQLLEQELAGVGDEHLHRAENRQASQVLRYSM
jgi:hypothetical protein